MEMNKDDRLWRIARKRASFKKSVYASLVLVGSLWAIWWITAGRFSFDAYPWPVWPTLGFGLALAFQYFDAYNGTHQDLAEKEYERLLREQEK